MSKVKGSKAERELQKIFWQNGWACLRTAGSGSSSHPAPDLLAGNKIRRLAVECKATKSISKYLTKEEIGQLIEFAQVFGAEPWVAIRFDRDNWYFISPEDLKETNNNYLASLEIAKNKGLLFEEVIN
ncbi:Holliday junction resolvase [Candidatus Woesearchaeota archaeon]|nr:Holliday junction resolvase [Candidatus Woesearchaeota archaeon]